MSADPPSHPIIPITLFLANLTIIAAPTDIFTSEISCVRCEGLQVNRPDPSLCSFAVETWSEADDIVESHDDTPVYSSRLPLTECAALDSFVVRPTDVLMTKLVHAESNALTSYFSPISRNFTTGYASCVWKLWTQSQERKLLMLSLRINGEGLED